VTIYANTGFFLVVFVALTVFALHNLIRYVGCKTKKGQQSNLLSFFYGILVLLFIGRIINLALAIYAWFRS